MEEASEKSYTQLRHEEKEKLNQEKLLVWLNDKRAQQALAARSAGKGKGGKGKGGKGKGGKGMPAPLTAATMYGGKGAPAFLTKELVPVPPLPPKKRVANVAPEVTPPSADALDLDEEAFPVLGMSMREKVNEEREAVSMGGSRAASMNKFMRETY